MLRSGPHPDRPRAPFAPSRSIWSPKDPNVLFYATAGVWKTTNGGHSWTPISGDLTRGRHWEIPANAGKYASTVTPAAQGSVTALAPSPLDVNVLWAGTGDGLIQVTTDGGAKWTNVTPPQIKALDAHLQHGRRPLRHQDRLRRRQHAAPRRHESALLAHPRWRQDVDRNRQRHRAAARWPIPFAKIRARRACSTPPPIPRSGSPSTTATTGIPCASNMPADFGARYRSEGRRVVHVLRSGGRHARPRLLDSRRRDSAAPGRRSRRGIQRISLQARHRHPHSLRHQRSHALAAGDAGRRKSAARRAGRLLPALGRRAK